MLTPEGEVEEKDPRKAITWVARLRITLDVAAFAAFLLGFLLTAPIKEFHWFLLSCVRFMGSSHRFLAGLSYGS